jgi:hypothetical protein
MRGVTSRSPVATALHRVALRAGAVGVTLVATLLVALVAGALFAGPAAAHAGGLSGARESLAIPTWLFLLTGGSVVGASFLLASFVTDRAFVRAVHGWRRVASVPAERLVVAGVRTLGVGGLVAVVIAGLLGPASATANLAVLLVWVGWWAGFTISAYLLGDSWPVLNPWRTLAERLPSLGYEYPERCGAWPGAGALLGLIWLEVVSPLADDPRLLAGVVLAYTTLTLAGAALFGSGTWFDRGDPISRVFRCYGAVAPIAHDGDRLRLRLPGTGLVETRLGTGEVAFVVALLWGTTYDGLVTTPGWRDAATALVGSGVPAPVLYPAALFAGFGLFVGVYRLAVRRGRAAAETYRPTSEIARRFAPSLLAIAAGYHLAHYLGYFLSLAPTLIAVAGAPLSPPAATPMLALPGWFGGVALAAVLAGHLLAIWVAHAIAYELFPSRLQAVRSQYALTAAMVFYTAVSLWVVVQPEGAPPYV